MLLHGVCCCIVVYCLYNTPGVEHFVQIGNKLMVHGPRVVTQAHSVAHAPAAKQCESGLGNVLRVDAAWWIITNVLMPAVMRQSASLS